MEKIPVRWQICKLRDVATIVTGNTPSKEDSNNYGSQYPWVKPPDLESKTPITQTKEYLSDKGAQKARLLPAKTVLVSCIGILGKVGLAGTTLATNQQINAVIFKNIVIPEYGFYFCKTLKEWLENNSSSTTVSIINKERFSEAPFILPPLNEQRRIVAKLEVLLGKVDGCQKRLEKIPRILKRFRQSVLAAACDGRLTADWREGNKDVEPAKISIKSSQFKLQAQLDELSELPEKWIWIPLGNYAQCSRGRFSHRPRNEPKFFGGKYPFIQIGDLPKDGGWIKYHTQTLNDEGLAISKMFPRGTIVIAIVGATIGNTGILAYDMCFTDSLVGIETKSEIGNKYVELFLRYKKDEIRQASYAGGGQPNIKLETLNPYPIPLPPLAEQQEIVRRVESLFKLADQLEARYQKAKSYVDKLTQSILAKAFRGELVAQDPNDEPASVLLERIKQEKEAATTEKSRKVSVKSKVANKKESKEIIVENKAHINDKFVEIVKENKSSNFNKMVAGIEKLGEQMTLPFIGED